MARVGKVGILVLVVGGLGVLSGGLWAVDKLISRSDRIHFEQRKAELVYVRDAIMRYEYRTGVLPSSLDTLIPSYLRRNQLYDEGRALYVYDRSARTIGMAEGSRIRGLVYRYRDARVMKLPEPEQRLQPHVAEVSRPLLPPPTTTTTTSSTTTTTVPIAVPATTTTTTTSTTRPPRRPDPTPASVIPREPESPAVDIPPFVVPKGPELANPPPGVLVFEAEHWSEMNWGWEIHPNAKSAGGAHIDCKEGMTTGSAQCHYATYNFYDIREGQQQAVLKYHFTIPKSGRYYLLGRLWATCSHCSNSLNLGIDTGGLKPGREYKDYYGQFMGSRTPFRWRWSYSRGTHYLRAGDHYIYVFPHEDGIMADQFMLVPTNIRNFWPRNTAYKTTLKMNRGTRFEKKAKAPVHLSFDVKSMVITAGMPAKAKLAIRRIRRAAGLGTFKVVMQSAGKDGRDLAVARQEIELSKLPELAFLPLDFSKLDYAALPRREYLLKAELVSGGKTLISENTVLMHPFAWQVSGDMKFLPLNEPGPLDADKESDDPKMKWEPFKEKNWTHLGILDFGMHTAGNSLHAPEMRTIYARTTIEVPKTDEYMLKLQSDDQMLLWIDGKLAHQISRTQSVIRNSHKVKIRLEKGMHRVRMRVNQGPEVRKLKGGYWQASMRIRTKDDLLSNVIGQKK